MKSYPLDKYKFYTTPEGKVIAVSTYAGRTVRGTAICSSEDKFDLEKGKKLAAARCNYKVSEKRLKRAEDKYDEAVLAFNQAIENMEKMEAYYFDAREALFDADAEIERLMERY